MVLGQQAKEGNIFFLSLQEKVVKKLERGALILREPISMTYITSYLSLEITLIQNIDVIYKNCVRTMVTAVHSTCEKAT